MSALNHSHANSCCNDVFDAAISLYPWSKAGYVARSEDGQNLEYQNIGYPKCQMGSQKHGDDARLYISPSLTARLGLCLISRGASAPQVMGLFYDVLVPIMASLNDLHQKQYHELSQNHPWLTQSEDLTAPVSMLSSIADAVDEVCHP